MSDQKPMNLQQKLIEVRKAVPYLQKAASGPQYQYVGSSQTLSSVMEKMNELGILLKQEIISQRVTQFHTAKGALQFMTDADMRFTWINADDPTDREEALWQGQGVDNGEKGIGKLATYAEKYFILKSFNIATDKDDPDSFQQKVEANKPKATEAMKSTIKQLATSLAGKTNQTPLEVFNGYGITADLTPDDAKRVTAELRKAIEAIEKEENPRLGETAEEAAMKDIEMEASGNV